MKPKTQPNTKIIDACMIFLIAQIWMLLWASSGSSLLSRVCLVMFLHMQINRRCCSAAAVCVQMSCRYMCVMRERSGWSGTANWGQMNYPLGFYRLLSTLKVSVSLCISSFFTYMFGHVMTAAVLWLLVHTNQYFKPPWHAMCGW